MVEIRGTSLLRKSLAAWDLADPQEQEVLMVLVEAGDDVALNVVLRVGVEDRLGRRSRHIHADKGRKYRDPDPVQGHGNEGELVQSRCREGGLCHRRVGAEVHLTEAAGANGEGRELLPAHGGSPV